MIVCVCVFVFVCVFVCSASDLGVLFDVVNGVVGAVC